MRVDQSKPRICINYNDNFLDDDDAYDEDFSPGRILDTRYGIMERTYDIEARRILLKFHREKGQVLFILSFQAKPTSYISDRNSDRNTWCTLLRSGSEWSFDQA